MTIQTFRLRSTQARTLTQYLFLFSHYIFSSFSSCRRQNLSLPPEDRTFFLRDRICPFLQKTDLPLPPEDRIVSSSRRHNCLFLQKTELSFPPEDRIVPSSRRQNCPFLQKTELPLPPEDLIPLLFFTPSQPVRFIRAIPRTELAC